MMGLRNAQRKYRLINDTYHESAPTIISDQLSFGRLAPGGYTAEIENDFVFCFFQRLEFFVGD